MSAFEFARPELLGLLAVPLLLLLIASRRGRPIDLATGTWELWRELGAERASDAQNSIPRPPAWALALAGALGVLVLALSGLSAVTTPQPRTFSVVLEPGDGLTLPFLEDEATDGRTRLDVALAEVESWLDEVLVGEDLVEWQIGRRLVARGRAVPALVRDHDALVLSEPSDPSEHDAPGTLWVAARAPAVELLASSWVASGGGAVPGPIAPSIGIGGEPIGRTVDASGRVVETPHGGDAVIIGEGLPRTVEDFVRLWATSRGLVTTTSGTALGSGPVWLRVGTRPSLGAIRARERVGRDGWAVEVDPPASASDPVLDEQADVTWPEGSVTWLHGETEPLVVSSPGTVLFTEREWSMPEGGPEAFALSLGTLLDRSCRPPQGRATAASRGSMGPTRTRRGELPGRGPEVEDDWAPRLATVAALLLGLAFWLAPRRRSMRRP